MRNKNVLSLQKKMGKQKARRKRQWCHYGIFSDAGTRILKTCKFYVRLLCLSCTNGCKPKSWPEECWHMTTSRRLSIFWSVMKNGWLKLVEPWAWAESENESCSVMSNSLWLQVRILEWVAFPFSRGSSQPGNWTQVSRTAGRFSTTWATRKAQEYWSG